MVTTEDLPNARSEMVAPALYRHTSVSDQGFFLSLPLDLDVDSVQKLCLSGSTKDAFVTILEDMDWEGGMPQSLPFLILSE